jgi:hypothetical protein
VGGVTALAFSQKCLLTLLGLASPEATMRGIITAASHGGMNLLYLEKGASFRIFPVRRKC